MFSKIKYSVLLLLVSVVFFSSCKNELGTKDFIKKKWSFVSIKNTKGEIVKKVDGKDTLKISDSIFSYKIRQEKIDATGKWKLKGDTLIFTYDLKPIANSIDSVSYEVIDKKPVIKFYNHNKELTRVAENGTISPNIVRYYKVAKCNSNELVLTEGDIEYRWRYEAIVDEGGFNFTALMRGMLGISFLTLVLWLISSNRKAISWKLVISGILFQIIFALLVLKVPFVEGIFEGISNFFVRVIEFTAKGSEFVFGNLASREKTGFYFAFQILPTIIFFSALTSIFFYYGILQKIVYGLAWLMGKTMKISGSENLSTAANIFLGQTEAPLMIKHYLPKMTRSELLCVMVGGMANTAGGVLAAYIGFLGGDDPAQQLFFAKHLLAASIMSAPATIVISKMLMPQTETIDEKLELTKEKLGTNVLEAIANGTSDGIRLAVNVAGMLIVFIALTYMVNSILNGIGSVSQLNEGIAHFTNGQYQNLSLQFILGYSLAPLTWMLGVHSQDITLVGQLLGEKTVLNEFNAYLSLGTLKANNAFHDPKSVIMSTYILSGFANFASIGIQIGGIGALAPNKKGVLSELGMKALIGGTIASLFTATIVGMLM